MKNKFQLGIAVFEKNENGQLKLIDKQWKTIRRKEFEQSVEEEKKKGVEHKIVSCNESPKRFQFNTIYLRNDGEMAYVFLLKEGE